MGTIKFPSFQNHFLCKHPSLLSERNIISISPGGFKGFYVSGIVTYIKEHYSLDSFVFSGASAGAWNALLFSFKRDPYELMVPIFENKIVQESKSIQIIEKNIKDWILSQYTADDFDLNRLFVGITVLHKCNIKTSIVTDFKDLEDAIDACIASSHIPFITGGLVNRYHNTFSFDGGFSRYPYLRTAKPILHITPSLWKEKEKPIRCSDLKELLTRNVDLLELFDSGYNDAKKNKPFLDALFTTL